MRHFDRELEQLKCKLLEMSSLVETAIHHSITAVVQKDPSLAEDVLKNEARINQMEIEIDDLAIKLLALQQPMAVDLRLITAALKINNDLERMGDLAVNIAQRALELIQEPVIKPLIDIPHIGALVQSMVRKALDSFVTRDEQLARSVLASDDAVDDLRTASIHELISFMEQAPRNIPQALSLLSVVRNLERIADHSTNIAEDVLFYVKGIDVRHHAEVRE
ncbi:MAG: phosphate signaling complex protein PhoU [Acidobacteriia bacterium]|nr:phosphate signaling complex protein PhoU [Terriglobia bacterium]